MGFLNEMVQFPVWGFGFIALGLFTALYASNRANAYKAELDSQADW